MTVTVPLCPKYRKTRAGKHCTTVSPESLPIKSKFLNPENCQAIQTGLKMTAPGYGRDRNPACNVGKGNKRQHPAMIPTQIIRNAPGLQQLASKPL